MNVRRFSGPIPCLIVVTVILVANKRLESEERSRPPAPAVVAVSADGSLYVGDLMQPGLLRLDPKGEPQDFTNVSRGPRTVLRGVTALAVGPEDTLFAADRATGDIYRVERDRSVALTGGSFEIPVGLAVTRGGDLIVADLRLNSVARVPARGGVPKKLADVRAPRAVAIDPSGRVVVLSMNVPQLVRLDPGGKIASITEGKPFRFPIALIADPQHARFFVSDSYAGSIYEVTETGVVRAWVKGPPLVRPEGLGLDHAGSLLVADPGAHQVFRIRAPGRIEPVHPAR